MRRVAALAAVVVLFGASACGQAPWEDSLKDYEGAEIRDPDEIVLFNNVDKHPNLARVCIDGLSFVTTTRDFKPYLRVPEWDMHCKGVR